MTASTGPCAGIYYVVREPAGWRLVVRRFARGEDYQHQAMWEDDLVPEFARLWAESLRVDARELESVLKLMVFAFPRGRITKFKDKFVVYHGNDLRPFMGVSEKDIEEAFGIVRVSRWKYDDHERCMDFEKVEVQRALLLTEDWPAANPGA